MIARMRILLGLTVAGLCIATFAPQVAQAQTRAEPAAQTQAQAGKLTLINHTGATWRAIFLKRGNLTRVFLPGQQASLSFTGYTEDWVEFDEYQAQGKWVEEASYKFSDYNTYTVYF